MAVDYSKWDKNIDTDGLKKDIEDAGHRDGDFEDVPVGDYVVKVSKLELVASKKNDPMVTIWFDILEGDQKGRKIFMNQVVTQGFQIHQANEFLKSLDSGVNVKFDTYTQYGQMILDIHEAIDGKLEYALKYGKNKKDYSTFKITEVYDVEIDEKNLPF